MAIGAARISDRDDTKMEKIVKENQGSDLIQFRPALHLTLSIQELKSQGDES
jgi:hypothetical protein